MSKEIDWNKGDEELRLQLMTDDEYTDAVVQEALAKQIKKEEGTESD